MIAYKSSDVKLSWTDNDSGGAGSAKVCGYVKEGEGNVSQSIVLNHPSIIQISWMSPDVEDKSDGGKDKLDTESVWSETPHAQSLKSAGKSREKRQADQYEYTPTKTRCPLLLVADYRFFQEMGGGNTKTTINYLVGLSKLSGWERFDRWKAARFHRSHAKELLIRKMQFLCNLGGIPWVLRQPFSTCRTSVWYIKLSSTDQSHWSRTQNL